MADLKGEKKMTGFLMYFLPCVGMNLWVIFSHGQNLSLHTEENDLMGSSSEGKGIQIERKTGAKWNNHMDQLQ